MMLMVKMIMIPYKKYKQVKILGNGELKRE